MASSSQPPAKKPKLSALDNLISALNRLGVDDSPKLSPFPVPDTDELNLPFGLGASVTIRPGIGLIGNDEEEEAYYQEWLATHDQADDQDDDDDEEELGDNDNITLGQDLFTLEDGEVVEATRYLGDEWVQHIRALYAVGPIPVPPNMAVTPHDYQLKAAAQAHWLCESRFKGMLLGDSMGVGKTLAAILAMYMVKDQPGFSMVVAPKTLCHQWVQSIESAFQNGHGLTTHLFEGSAKLTAHDLLALGVDVVVVSYDQVDAAQRDLRTFPDRLDMYLNDKTGFVRKPKRALAPLHSPFWRLIDMPIKRLVLDEAQVINKRSGVRHQAVKALFFKAVIQLSGTFAHNKWHDFSGYVDFLSGHPFLTHRAFMKAFSTYDYSGKTERPDLAKTRLLQRFLQAFTIARPVDIVNLKKCPRARSFFKLESPAISKEIVDWINKFNMGGDDEAVKLQQETDTGIDSSWMGLLIKAQLASIHPLLAKEREEMDHQDEGTDEDASHWHDDGADWKPEERSKWLKRVEDTEDLYHGSKRLRHFIEVYQEIRTFLPGRKIVVFSQFLKFLDIIAEAMKRDGIQPLRYDGSVEMRRRPNVQRDFKAADPAIPLLLTAGAGGFGLNITCASVVIQTEIWWNSNNEAQAVSRAWRQGQTQEVLYVQLFAEDSAIDKMMLRVQNRKNTVNSDIMQAIVRHPGEKPDIRELRLIPHLPVIKLEESERGIGNREH